MSLLKLKNHTFVQGDQFIEISTRARVIGECWFETKKSVIKSDIKVKKCPKRINYLSIYVYKRNFIRFFYNLKVACILSNEFCQI